MTTQDGILVALPGIEGRSADHTLQPWDAVDELRRRGSSYAESTLRTHVISRMADPVNQSDIEGKAIPAIIWVVVAAARAIATACRVAKKLVRAGDEVRRIAGLEGMQLSTSTGVPVDDRSVRSDLQ